MRVDDLVLLLIRLQGLVPISNVVTLSPDIAPERIVVVWASRHLPGGGWWCRMPCPEDEEGLLRECRAFLKPKLDEMRKEEVPDATASRG